MINISDLINYFKSNRIFFFFLLFCGSFFGIFLLSANYYYMPKDGMQDYILILLHWGLVCFAYFVLVYFLALQKVIFLIVFPVLNFVSAILLYFIVGFDISINGILIESTLNTNLSEAMDLISTGLIIYSSLIFTASLVFALYRFRKIKVKYFLFHIVLILIGYGICLTANKLRYKTISHRVPFSVYSAVKQNYRNAKLLKEDRIRITENAKCNEDTLTVVFVLGEALRADHVGMNGYFRATTPRLENENVISYTNIYSEWTHTNQSVPHILTRADSTNSDLAFTEQSFISIFKACGFKTFWIGNQEPGNTYLNFMYDCDKNIINKPFVTVYNYNKKLDEELFSYFDTLNSLVNPLKLFILQTIGSHWYYPSHYSDQFEHFKPVIKGKTIGNKDKGKMINAYDNTVLYTDYFLSEIINKLKGKNAVLIYLSDHGEILGENGKWLHAQGTDWERNPACFLWFSEKNRKKNLEIIEIASGKKDEFIQTDFLFHSILHVSKIESPYLNYELSIFSENSFSSQ